MTFFTNKHVIAAMIVAPILAVLGWLLVDLLVKEEAHKAVSGQAYPLAAQSNCRFESGGCHLKNGTFEVRVSVDVEAAGAPMLRFESGHALDKAVVGFVTEPDAQRVSDDAVEFSTESAGETVGPFSMEQKDDLGHTWILALPENVSRSSRMRMALTAQNARYYAETQMTFKTYETSYNKDFRGQ